MVYIYLTLITLLIPLLNALGQHEVNSKQLNQRKVYDHTFNNNLFTISLQFTNYLNKLRTNSNLLLLDLKNLNSDSTLPASNPTDSPTPSEISVKFLEYLKIIINKLLINVIYHPTHIIE